MTRLESDIFKSAYFICMGADLIEVKFENSQIASFVITGCDLDRYDRDFSCGRALVNPVQLRATLNYLKDILFGKMRQRNGRYENAKKRRK